MSRQAVGGQETKADPGSAAVTAKRVSTAE
jgi:hypothetical protein